MTQEQENHLARIKIDVSARLDSKYRAGQAEHGGNLWDLDPKALLEESINESIDDLTYKLTLYRSLFGNLLNDPKIPGIVGFERKPVRDTVQVMQPRGRAILKPQREGDVGYDLVVSDDTELPGFGANDGKATVVPSAVKIKIPPGYYAQIVGRSSAANKCGILVHTATIDNGYTGQLFACCWNMSAEPKIVEAGMRLAQVIFLPIHTPPIADVDELPETARGEEGFGSTGGHFEKESL